MLAETGALLGSGAGGLLGQVGQVLSAPRRGLWSALGLPEHGNDLVARTFGLDPDAWYTHGLGMGAEMALDPLTYAGMLAGGPLTKLFGRATMAAPAAAGEEIAALTAARRAAQEGLVNRAALEADIAAAHAARAPGLNALDIPGIAGGRTKSFALADPSALGELESAGLASANPRLGPTLPGEPALPSGATVLGRQPPPGFGLAHMQRPGGGDRAMLGRGLGRTGPGDLPGLAASEVDDLASIAARQPGGWEGLTAAVPSPAGVPIAGGLKPAGVVDEMLRHAASRQIGNTPHELLRGAMGGGMQRPWADALGPMLDLPLPQAFEDAQAGLASALARQQAKQAAYRAATTLSPLEGAQIVGAGGLGGYAGGMMGNEMMGGGRRR